MAFETAATIVNTAAVELGLIPFTNQPADPFGSTDSNIGRLCMMLKTACTYLRQSRQWTHLRQTYTFNTVSNVGRYALADDYGQIIDQTAWNRTNRLPMGGPLSAQEFEYLKARLVGVVFTVLYEIIQGKFQAYPDTDTPGDYVIAYEYVSSFTAIPTGTQTTEGTWQPGTAYSGGGQIQLPGGGYGPTGFVINGGNIYLTTAGGTSGNYGPTGTGSNISDGGITDWTWMSASGLVTPTASTDTIQLSSDLVSRYLKLLWKRELGFDIAGATQEYQEVFDRVAGDDSVAPVLNLGRGRMDEPLIGERNLPYTGFGS